MTHGIYFDGASSNPMPVRIDWHEQNLRLVKPDQSLVSWDIGALSIEKEYEARSGQAVFSTKEFPSARLILNDPAVYNAIISRLKRQHAFTIPFTLKSLSLLAALSIAFLAAGFYLLKYESEHLAPMIPLKAQMALADMVVKDGLKKPTKCRAGMVQIRKIAAQIARDNGLKTPRVFIDADREVNAYALPADTLLIHQGLIAAAQKEAEIAGILAHEMGHLHHYHPQQKFLQSAGFGIFAWLTLGTADSNMLSNLVTMFHDIHYSKHMEAEADRTAEKFMAESGIDPNGLAAFFTRLEEKPKSEVEKLMEEYLSTHPSLESRAGMFTAKKPGAYKNILTRAEWDKLKKACP